MSRTNIFKFFGAIVLSTSILMTWPALGQEIKVLGSLDETIDWLKKENWWGKEKRGEQLQVPRTMIMGISQRWQKNAQTTMVQVKKNFSTGLYCRW